MTLIGSGPAASRGRVKIDTYTSLKLFYDCNDLFWDVFEIRAIVVTGQSWERPALAAAPTLEMPRPSPQHSD